MELEEGVEGAMDERKIVAVDCGLDLVWLCYHVKIIE
jgi:hypothetical protein